jgi:hypothetical protein
MSYEEGTKKVEAGKTEHSPQELGYDYDHAISEATRLWTELRERHASRGWKYPPRDAAFEHLLSAWRTHPGKTIVHLLDMPDFIHVKLDAYGIELMKKEWWKLVAEHSFRVAYKQHPGIYHTTTGSHLTISVDELRKLATKVNVSFEEYVVGIRPGANGKPFNTKLPLRVDSAPFGELFGFYGDLMQEQSGHVTKDKQVQEEFVRTVELALGPVDSSISTTTEGYTRTYTTSMVQHLLGIGGLNTSIRQLPANNPAPLFLFASPDNVVRAYLKSLFESEGGVSYNKKRKAPASVDLHQAVICKPPEEIPIPRHPGKVYFTRIGTPENLLDTPPRVLTAASLLLVRLNISNRLCPASLYVNDLNEKVIRWRLMITGPDIETYRQRIGFISTRKQNKLQPKNSTSSPSSLFSQWCLNCDRMYDIQMKPRGKYTVYASVYNIPPPTAKIKCDCMAVVDLKGRLLYHQTGGNLHWYDGRFSKKMAREVVASCLNVEWEDDSAFSEKDVRLVDSPEVEEIIERSKSGGFTFYIAVNNTPEERVLQIRAIYYQLGKSVPRPERESPVLVKTAGEVEEAGIKLRLVLHLKEAYDYLVEPSEIELVSDEKLEKLRQDAKEEGYDYVVS